MRVGQLEKVGNLERTGEQEKVDSLGMVDRLEESEMLGIFEIGVRIETAGGHKQSWERQDQTCCSFR